LHGISGRNVLTTTERKQRLLIVTATALMLHREGAASLGHEPRYSADVASFHLSGWAAFDHRSSPLYSAIDLVKKSGSFGRPGKLGVEEAHGDKRTLDTEGNGGAWSRPVSLEPDAALVTRLRKSAAVCT
jgi:hypothetical protein